MTTGERLLSRAESAEYLTQRGYKTASATLAKLAVVGGGPPFISWGRKPLYDPGMLIQWAKARCTGPRRSTSDRGEKIRPEEASAPVKTDGGYTATRQSAVTLLQTNPEPLRHG